jgi:hypothetical protein
VSTTLEALIAERATRVDPLDLPLSTTRREADAYAAQTAELDRRIGAARSAQATLANLVPRLEPYEKWRGLEVQWLDQFANEMPPVDDRDRAAVERRQALALSIINIRSGCSYWPTGAPQLGKPLAEAIAAAGYTESERPGPAWFGSLPEVEHRIADLRERIDAAQAQLTDALLDDEERSKRDAQGAARIAALRALPQRKTRGDGTQYDKYPDGRRVEV